MVSSPDRRSSRGAQEIQRGYLLRYPGFDMIAHSGPGKRRELMLGVQNFWLFVFAGCLLNVTPGPDIAYIVARSAQCGVRGGVAAAFGITAGCLVHITAAAIGVSAILMTSALAFNALKWVGAAYLVYIGFKMLFASRGQQESLQSSIRPPAAIGMRTIFFQGFLTNVLNPKVALFFLAFLPQFIRSDASSKAMAFVILGLAFAATGTVWNLIVAWSAGRLAAAWSGLGRMRQWLERSLGALFVGLGVRLALSDAR
jgi:threonine/homoserine/homoserine lactone efflux protein